MSLDPNQNAVIGDEVIAGILTQAAKEINAVVKQINTLRRERFHQPIAITTTVSAPANK